MAQRHKDLESSRDESPREIGGNKRKTCVKTAGLRARNRNAYLSRNRWTNVHNIYTESFYKKLSSHFGFGYANVTETSHYDVRARVPVIGLLVTHSKKQQEVLTAFRLHYKGISVLFFSCSVLSNYDSKASLFTVMTHTVSSLATKLQPSLTDYTRAAVIRRKQRVLSKENRKTHSTRIPTLIENKHVWNENRESISERQS
jgi:hypothetical protein